MTQGYAYSRDIAASAEGAFFRRVYNWMVAGLAITGGAAWFVAGSPAMLQLIAGNNITFFGLIIAELGMVFYLSARINRLSAGTATGLFLAYSLLNGLTLSVVLFAATKSSVATAFFVTAGTFAGMSVYGYTTKRSLQSWGGFLFMGLIGIIIASIVNYFLANPMMQWLISFAGVIVFTGLTAYDTQKLRVIHAGGFANEDMESKAAIMGALNLYLDFINLFLFILRIFSGGRD